MAHSNLGREAVITPISGGRGGTGRATVNEGMSGEEELVERKWDWKGMEEWEYYQSKSNIREHLLTVVNFRNQRRNRREPVLNVD